MVVAGIAQQGLWAIANGSTTWTRLGQGAGSAKIVNRPSSITYDPDASEHLLGESGIYNGGGAYETLDNGITFKAARHPRPTDFVSVDLTRPGGPCCPAATSRRTCTGRGTEEATWVDLPSKLPSGVGYTTSPLVVGSSVYLLGTSAGARLRRVPRPTRGRPGHKESTGAPCRVPRSSAKSDGAICCLLDRGAASAGHGQGCHLAEGSRTRGRLGQRGHPHRATRRAAGDIRRKGARIGGPRRHLAVRRSAAAIRPTGMTYAPSARLSSSGGSTASEADTSGQGRRDRAPGLRLQDAVDLGGGRPVAGACYPGWVRGRMLWQAGR